MIKPDDNEKNTYSISELSKEFDVTPRALRLYEDEGLLSPKREGTRRIYSRGDRVRIRLILRGKRLGCSLSDIKEIFEAYDYKGGEKSQLESLLEKLHKRKEVLETQKRDIEQSLIELKDAIRNAEGALESIERGERPIKSA